MTYISRSGRLTWLVLAATLAFSGCASDGGAKLPSALAARWSPPPFATRTVDAGDLRTVLRAGRKAVIGGGYVVQRYNEEAGFLSAARRQTTAFDGSRQDTLELRTTAVSPGAIRVALVLREVVESGAGDGRDAGVVTSGIVRDRVAYDAFFERLAAFLTAP